MYRYSLEQGSKKHLCPGCGRKTFVRVVDSVTGKYLPESIGRCDRESKCGYQYTSKDHFRDSTDGRWEAEHEQTRLRRITMPRSSQGVPPGPALGDRYRAVGPAVEADYLELRHLLATIGNYGHNSFVQFLTELLPSSPEAVSDAVKEYRIGTYDDWTSFPVISRHGKFCKAKLMKFDPATGKRLKDKNGRSLIHSLQAKLKESGLITPDFETDKDVFFGEHLLSKYPKWPIAIVESEKTAVIASICRGVFPDIIWLASGSKQWLNTARLERLGRDRSVILYPDADGYERWQEIAADASRRGCLVKVSGLIERQATEEEKANQADIADYLIRERKNDLTKKELRIEL